MWTANCKLCVKYVPHLWTVQLFSLYNGVYMHTKNPLIYERFNMNTTIRMLTAAVFLPLSISGCLMTGGTAEQNSVLVSELSSICGAIVGSQAEQRINQEWAKYPEAQANRPVIEAVAEVLLNDPTVSEQQRTTQYKSYLTCATGLLVTNGMMSK